MQHCQSKLLSVASFPGRSCFQLLITCSMQKRREKPPLFGYCKQSKTGVGNSLGMRAVCIAVQTFRHDMGQSLKNLKVGLAVVLFPDPQNRGSGNETRLAITMCTCNQLYTKSVTRVTLSLPYLLFLLGYL